MSPAIRLATVDDAQQLHAIYAPIVAETVVSFELEPPSVEEMRRRIGTTLLTFPWLVCERDGVIGYAYAGVFRSRPASLPPQLRRPRTRRLHRDDRVC